MKIIDGKPEYRGAVVSVFDDDPCLLCGRTRVGWMLVS